MPTAEARVAETMAGVHRAAADQGGLPSKKRATADLLRQILAPIPDDLRRLRDRAHLLIGSRARCAAPSLPGFGSSTLRRAHLEARERGLRLTLPRSKGERARKPVAVAIPCGATALCPVRALGRWQDAACVTEGPMFRRTWMPPGGNDRAGPPPLPRGRPHAIRPGQRRPHRPEARRRGRIRRRRPRRP